MTCQFEINLVILDPAQKLSANKCKVAFYWCILITKTFLPCHHDISVYVSQMVCILETVSLLTQGLRIKPEIKVPTAVH